MWTPMPPSVAKLHEHGLLGDRAPNLAATPKDTVFIDGTASLYHFRPQVATSGQTNASTAAAPVLVVPSLINRWFVVDLRPGFSLCEALVQAGLDTWCLDWGVPEAEDRYITWDDLIDRLDRMVRRVQRETGAPRVSLLGYCIGGTLCAVETALHPERIAGLINLAGPFDFSKIGKLGQMTQPAWFDGDAIAAAGNMGASEMQAGFQALRPTASISKWIQLADKSHDSRAVESFLALEAWASDNIPFPAAAYGVWIRDFYQGNKLIAGEHRVHGRQVDLKAITCPVLTVVTERDEICPPLAAKGLQSCVSSQDCQTLTVPGGHVGAVIGRMAKVHLYPQMAAWLLEKS